MAGHSVGVLDHARLVGEVVPALRAGVDHPLVAREIGLLRGQPELRSGALAEADFAGLGSVVTGHFDALLSTPSWRAEDVVVAGDVRRGPAPPGARGAWGLGELGLLVEAMTMRCVDPVAQLGGVSAVGQYLVGVYDRQDRTEETSGESDPELAVLAALLERLRVRWSYWHGHAAAGLRGFLDPAETRDLARLLARLLPSVDPWLRADRLGAAAELFRRVCDLAAARHHGLLWACDLRVDLDLWARYDPHRACTVLHAS